MTEEEAKTKFCPFSRVMIEAKDGQHHGPMNRSVNAQGLKRNSTCIGRDCMMWHYTASPSVGFCGLNTASTRLFYGADD